MKYIKGKNRTQTYLFPISLEESIEKENEVRLIDAFVDSLPFREFGFKVDFIDNGRPAYHASDLLKLYMYGYMNRIRSSRGLEKECKRNIEVMWLINNLSPDHNTISNFRRDNSKSIKKVFRQTVKIAQHFELIGGALLAGDSTKFRAQNSKKNNFNEKKIQRHLEYIDNKIDEYEKQLAQNDGDGQEEIKKGIDQQQKRKAHYHNIQEQIKESGNKQVSTSDPESRHMIIRNNITEVAYNAQTTTDSKHNIPVDFKLTNTNDSKAMGNMLQRAKSILHSNDFTALYDKGYHTSSEFDIAEKLGIDVLVAIPGIPSSSHAPNRAYDVENFKYDDQSNSYICPQGNRMITNGNWYKSKNGSLFQQYKTKQCKGCKVRELCTKSEKNGKIVKRRKNAENIEANRQRIEANKSLYKKRQAIVEHPYGTIKRQWGFNYIITKKYMERASSDVGFMFIAYNFKRIINILGVKILLDYLKSCENLFLCFFLQYAFKLAVLKRLNISIQKPKRFFDNCFKPLILTQNLALNGGF